MKQHELARALNLKASERTAFRHVLYEMERNRQVVRLRKNRWALPDIDREVIGVLQVNPQRFGFVTPDSPGLADIFIPEEGLGTALDGDRVAVVLGDRRAPQPAKPRSDRRGPASERLSTGRIVRVLERGRPEVVGLLRKAAHHWYVIPDSPRLLHNIRVSEFADGLKPAEQHKVMIRLGEWTHPHLPLPGTVTEDLGSVHTPGVDVLSVIRDHGIDPEYPEAAAREAKRHSPALPKSEWTGRQDLRSELTFTVDPEDAKDHDDAVSLQKTSSGLWRLDVHIADVPAFVTPGSAVDREALHRGNSTYLVDRSIPMLPPYLTSDICSLVPDKDRLAHTVRMHFHNDGRMVDSKTFPSVIRSAARLTYDQVQAFFDRAVPGGMSEKIRSALLEMKDLGMKLRKRRMVGGSIDLTMPETRIQLDREGKPVRIVKRPPCESYQLIEEFMLVANCVVADILARNEVPAIYRIHEAPDEEQLGRMAEDLGALGIRESPTTREQINRICRRAAGTPMEYAVSLACLRNMKRALYSATLHEHFGLGFDRYTHFTSPIRRYADLLVHRMLRAVEERKPSPYTSRDVAEIAAQCCRTEQNADDAEQASIELKRLEYFEGRLRAGEIGPYAAIVISLNPKGLVVELVDSLQRGMIPFSTMTEDSFVLSGNGRSAKGRKHGKTWFVGQTLDVFLSKVDRARKRVELYLRGEERTGGARKGKPVRRESRERHRMR